MTYMLSHSTRNPSAMLESTLRRMKVVHRANPRLDAQRVVLAVRSVVGYCVVLCLAEQSRELLAAETMDRGRRDGPSVGFFMASLVPLGLAIRFLVLRLNCGCRDGAKIRMGFRLDVAF